MKVRIFPASKDDVAFSADVIAAIGRLCVGRCVSYSMISEARSVHGLPGVVHDFSGIEIWISGKDQPEPAPEPPQESASWRDRPPLL